MRLNKRIVFIIATAICALIIGYVIGTSKSFRQPKDFCEGDENYRIQVCPTIRIVEAHDNGGYTINYFCSRQVYVLIYNLDEYGKSKLQQRFFEYAQSGFKTKKICENKSIKVIKFYKSNEVSI